MRRGFTLVEVLVALVLGGLVALLAHQVFAGALAAGAAMREARVVLDRRSNAHRFLAAAFLSLEVGPAAAGPFEGYPDRVRFGAWLETPDGWFEREAIELHVDGNRLLAAIAGHKPIVLAEGLSVVRFDYLLEPGNDAKWVGQWISPVSAPIAVRILTKHDDERATSTADTTLYLIKARG